MKLIVVESPAKTAKIASFLGAGYKVLASFGHIRALEETLDAVGLDNDFTPKYTFLKEKGKAIAALKAAAAEANEVILASDDDREGEAIAYSIAALLRLPATTTKRAVFHEITKTAVTAAIANPRVIDMNRVYAQQSRAMLDMMVGFTISPLLWKHVGPGLSAGRCQTPALRFVCDREAEIEGHATESSWAMTGTWHAAHPTTFPAALIDELADQESALSFLESLRDEPAATITKAVTSPWSAAAPPPLITSTLQQEASALYKCNPKATMRAAQRLYEAGHITYMRTDSAVLSEEAAAAARELVEGRFGATYLAAAAAAAAKPQQAKKKAAAGAAAAAAAAVAAQQPKAQEAHEAIRPTHFDLEQLPAEEEWSSQERKIYRLIWLRAIQSVMAPAKGEQRLIQFLSAAEDLAEFPWQAKWRRTTFPGWKALGAAAANLDEETDAEEDADAEAAAKQWALACALQVDTRLSWAALKAEPKETKAAPRYTEATLVRQLERKGIGRPSTFASLIAAIQDKGYVETKDIPGVKKIFNILSLKPKQWPPSAEPVEKMVGAERGKLVPTALGKSALAFALQHFQDLFDYSFTAAMEQQLDEIAEGKAPWKRVLRQTWDSYKERYEALKGAGGYASASASASLERVRDFGQGLKAVLSRKGPLLLQEVEGAAKPTFYGWPGRKAFHELTEEEARKFAESRVADSAEVVLGGGGNSSSSDAEADADSSTPTDKIVKKKGKFGYYAECNGVRVSCEESDGYKEIAAKLAAKAAASKPVRVGPYEFRVGQYGPYMFKTDLKTKKFVSVPRELDASSLTVKAAEAIYKAGLEAQAKHKKAT